jgi:Ca2+-binding RTX toxin-like protein
VTIRFVYNSSVLGAASRADNFPDRHRLDKFLENLSLVGAANINGKGNNLNNIVTGNTGSNLLDGGEGADTLAGGLGDDIYVVDNTNDVVSESSGAGYDTVESSITYLLGANLENLTLSGTSAISGTGNGLNNIITGNVANNLLLGGDGNDSLDGGIGVDTMDGGLGDDIYVIDDIADVVTEADLAGIDTIKSSISFELSKYFENLSLSGAASINGKGNSFNNAITGNSGNNILDGSFGADTLVGGLGDDRYVVDDIADVVLEASGAGTDTVESSISYQLDANLENLTLTGTVAISGTGNDMDNSIKGNAAKNLLVGGDGNDSLDGGIGADSMDGGFGDDIYVVDDLVDVVSEASGAGIDTVESFITYQLGVNLENLTLIGTAHINGTGNRLDNIIIGNTANNLLVGGDGNDILIGGTGEDTMAGGSGNDTFVVDNVLDVVSEASGGGTDTVESSITYTLIDTFLENLTLSGSANISGTGNMLKNIITGNSGSNILDGGLGADILSGGFGDDIYVVDNNDDVVSEASNAGIDTVQSSIDYTLAANLEHLTLLGTAAINGEGNGLANKITGNTGSNILDGGEGADILSGGLGDDTYVVDHINDVVLEAALAGSDWVQSSISYTLGENLENLFLTGNAAISGVGNNLSNTIIGNTANNRLVGGEGNDILNGGIGVDVMDGGLGDDFYVVDHTFDLVLESSLGGADTVQSYVSYLLGANLENLVLIGTDASMAQVTAWTTSSRGTRAATSLMAATVPTTWLAD